MTIRTALTTGANSGIGLATALELARRGLDSVGSVRSEAKAEDVARAAAAAKVDVRTVLLDVTDGDTCHEVIDAVRPDVLVNNAGFPLVRAIEDFTDEEARHAFETMVLAPMRLARQAIPIMRRRKGGRIINVSSIYGLTTTPLTGWYQGCKHALEALSDAMRMEVDRDGIHVVLIEPGGIRTGIWQEVESQVSGLERSRYIGSYERSRELSKGWQWLMGDPAACAEVIADAATSRTPRSRYLVGRDAQLLSAWSWLVPTRVRDEIVRRSVGL